MQQKKYGDSHADLFDLMYGEEAPPPMVDALEKLADGGPVLELGVGTGRVAIPLAKRGLNVAGIDNSSDMLAKLAAKPGGEKVNARVGELPKIDVEGQYNLILCLDQTFLLIPDQDAQIQCLVQAASKLAPGGKIVLEMFASASPPGEGVMLTHANDKVTVLWAFVSNPLTQNFHNRELAITDDGITVMPFNGRGVSVAELDLMARLAGLKLSARWGDWSGTPPSGSEMSLVSVFEAK